MIGLRQSLLVLGAAVSLVAAACGGSASPTTAATATTAPPPATTTTIPATTPATTVPATTTMQPTTTTTEPPLPQLALQVDGFGVLGGGAHYEGWAIIDGLAVSTGKFLVDETGRLTDIGGHPYDTVSVDADLGAATTIIITIEPAGDDDDVPADVHLVAGDLIDGTATLTIDHPAALGTDFADASGKFVLATPSTSTKDDELSGIWFLLLPGPVPSLDLPELPAGWKYEGWAVIDGQPLTSGKFLAVDAADESFPFGGPGRMPNFPGEDFVANAPAGVTFPTDLSGARVFVSVEPFPDDGAAPFVLQPLSGFAGDPAQREPVAYDLALNIGSLPTATATVS